MRTLPLSKKAQTGGFWWVSVAIGGFWWVHEEFFSQLGTNRNDLVPKRNARSFQDSQLKSLSTLNSAVMPPGKMTKMTFSNIGMTSSKVTKSHPKS